MMRQKLEWKLLEKQNLGLLDFIGQDYNYETKQAIMKYVFSEHFRLCKFKNPIGSIAFVYQVDPKTNKILNVSAGSVLENKITGERKSDLVMDNLGSLMGKMMKLRNLGGSGSSQIVKIDGNLGTTTDGFRTNTDDDNGEFFSDSTARPFGWTGLLGSGTTPPTRQDFQIESQLSDTPTFSIVGTYDDIGFQVLWSGQTVVVTGGETVSECVTYKGYSHGVGITNTETSMRTRDLVSPTFVTITAKTIFVDVVFNI